MNSKLSEVSQRHSIDHGPVIEQNEPFNPLIEIEKRIRDFFETNKELMGKSFVDFNKLVLKRCKWSLRQNEYLPAALQNELDAFSKQDSSHVIHEIVSWIDFESHQPLLSFFNKKFITPRLPSSLRKPIRIEKYLNRTAVLLEKQTGRYSDDEIRDYVKILVEFSNYSDLDPSTKIAPLIKYLERTDYLQFFLVMESALGMEATLGARFIAILISDKYLSALRRSHAFSPLAKDTLPRSAEANLERNIKRGLRVLLGNSSPAYNVYFADVLYDLLGDPNNDALIGRFFKNTPNLELLDHRLRQILQKIIKESSREQSSKIDHVMQHILRNQNLLNRLNEHPLPASENKKLARLILKAYQWNELPENLRARMQSQIFNPLLYKIESFMHIGEGEVQEKIVLIFLNSIAHDRQILIEECRKSHGHLEGISQLFKTLSGRFNCREIFDGQSLQFLNYTLAHFLQISQIQGESSKKIMLVEKILNAFLQVKLKDLRGMILKETIQKFYNETTKIFRGIETLTVLEQKEPLFKNLCNKGNFHDFT